MSLQQQRIASVSVITLTVLFLAAFVLAIPAAEAQTYSVLHNFTGQGDGGMPDAGLTRDAAGNFYGAAYSGGVGNNGVVFKLTRQGSGWILSTLYTFRGGEDGSGAAGGITIGPDGAIYGTTYHGGGNGCSGTGCGIVYRLTPPPTVCKSVSCSWTETVIYRFGLSPGDGTLPEYGSPLFDRAGNLYGTTSAGGSSPNCSGGCGTVYELTPGNGGWTETKLFSFNGSEYGSQPTDSLIFDNAGNLYGTTTEGGCCAGVVFELSPSGSGWTETILAAAATQSYGGLAWDAQGNLYGGTAHGNGSGGGVVFQLVPSGASWVYNQLLSFGSEAGPYDTPTLDSAGNVYVSAYAAATFGLIVKLTQSQGMWTPTVLHSFDVMDGEYPVGSVVLDANGSVYGTTSLGGSNGQGVIFEITP